MIRKWGIWLFVICTVVLPIAVFAVVKWYQHAFVSLPVLGPEHHRIAEFQMVNQDGAMTGLQDWDDKIVIADFFFTNCPVVCPKMTRSIKKAQGLFAGNKEIMFASFSVDPLRDSVSQLRNYAKRMDIKNNWILMTGKKKDIYKLARKSFMVVATDGDGGPDDFIHSELLVLVDKKKRIRGYYNGTDEEDVNALLRDIKKLQSEYY
jgi:protein SCO1